MHDMADKILNVLFHDCCFPDLSNFLLALPWRTVLCPWKFTALSQFTGLSTFCGDRKMPPRSSISFYLWLIIL